MIHRELESSFAARVSALTTGTALAGISIRHGVPATDLSYPCLIITASGAELIEGGVRNASRINMDFAVVSAASQTGGWQTTHKNRVAALARILDDTNTNASIIAINTAQSAFTLYGWAVTEVASDTSPNHQGDSIRISVVAGDRIGNAQSGKTNATPQDFSIRHEVEQILSAHLASELPGSVTAAYSVQPYYNEANAASSRIVAACQGASKPFPQLDRYTAQATVHVITAGIDSTAHVAAVREVQDALRSLLAQDFTSSEITVAGLLEANHSSDSDSNRITDVLGLNIYAQVN
jgi:hypothetical protein